ncbi:MAG TPA: DUF5655 domain-containing protein [Pseudonocardiaceae bacterium]|nr:DUF5655 domain-containing protein [Pseudonocardiaceae bacterium]
MDEWTAADLLRDMPAGSVALYERFIELVTACGPFTYRVTKSMITVKGVRRGFAGARPTARGLAGYFDIQRVITDPRILRADPYTKRLFVHQFRISTIDQLDDDFASWIGEAYRVGTGDHMIAKA